MWYTRLSRENGKLRERIEHYEAQESEISENQVNEIIDALRKNDRKTYVWRQKAEDWGEPIDTNLLVLFETIAPDLIDEASNKTLADALAFYFAGNDTRSYGWAFPSNFLKAYLADFVSLDIVTTSSKRHSVSDTQAYWMLTDFGREVYGNIRKNELLKGLVQFEESPEAEDES